MTKHIGFNADFLLYRERLGAGEKNTPKMAIIQLGQAFKKTRPLSAVLENRRA